MHAQRWQGRFSFKQIFTSFFLTGLSLLVGCGEQPPPPPPTPEVGYIELHKESYPLYTELSARTSPYMVSDVRPQISGIIQKRVFTEGADVAENELLYQINPSLYKATYDNAKANLAKAEASVVSSRLLAERYQQIVKVKAVSKQDYDNAVASYNQARAEVAAAKAALETAHINLTYTKVTSPIAGRIGRSTVTAGALVTQNQSAAMATVQQLNPMYVDMIQSSVDLLRLRRAFENNKLRSSGEAALQVTLKLEDGTSYTSRVPKKDQDGQVVLDANNQPVLVDEPIVGLLEFRDVTVDQGTGTITIRAKFPNPDDVLLPNMYVRAMIQEGVTDNAIFIPQKAVIRDNRGRAIAQVLTKNPPKNLLQTAEAQGSKAKDGASTATAPPPLAEDEYYTAARVLTIDRARGNEWLISAGLQPSDKLLVEGIMKVHPGKPVRGKLVDKKALAAENAAVPPGAQAAPISRQ